MPSDKPKFSGIVKSARGNGFFLIEIITESDEDVYALCRLSGKMRTHNIKVVEGDRVDVELDMYDMKKGVITYRSR